MSEPSNASSPGSTSPLSASKQQAIKELIQKYYVQLTKGCGDPKCTNPNCASNPATPQLDSATAVQKAIELAKGSDRHFCSSSVGAISTTVSTNAAVSSPPPAVDGLTLSQLEELVKTATGTGVPTMVIRTVGRVFSSEDLLNSSFLVATAEPTAPFAGVDIEAVKRSYSLLFDMGHEGVQNALATAITSVLLNMSPASLSSPPRLRLFLILMLNPQMTDPSHAKLFINFVSATSRLNATAQQVLQEWFTQLPPDVFDQFLNAAQTFISVRILSSGILDVHEDRPIVNTTKLLKLMYDANIQRMFVPLTDFYNETLNERVDLREDFARWYERHHDPIREAEGSGAEQFFSFCDHSFILEPASKSKILKYDAAVQQHRQAEIAVLQTLLQGPRAQTSPYLVLRIRRERLLEDALAQLMGKSDVELKKQLKVVFAGEEGVDEGGVQKEFFQLLIRDLIDVKYGMFVADEEARTLWFNRDSLEASSQFRLVGILLGLAIYNGVILDVRFPMVVYKKLCDLEPTLDDLIDAKPSLGKGLKQLLEFEGDVASTFAQSFQLSYESFGAVQTIDLKPGGADILVDNENRHEYVSLYVKHILVDSVKQQFDAFYNGFHSVCGGLALKLFRPQELELLVCGNPKLDFEALEKGSRYDNGYSPDHTVIRWFWDIIHSLEEAKKKRFLFFCTGSDRAPIKGLESLKLVIARNGPDSDRLPTAHTCFNHLLLPEYSSKEKLQRFLLMAIENAEGFGLR